MVLTEQRPDKLRRAPGGCGGGAVSSTAVSALAIWLFLLARPAGAAPTFQTSLDRDTISLGDTATLSMTFTEGAPRSQPAVPAIAGLQFGATGFSQQMYINNGQAAGSAVYTLELAPTRTGEFTIPALNAEVDGRRLTSRPLKLRVIKGNAAADRSPETPFVVLVPSTTNVCLGQVFLVEVQGYCMNNVSINQLPQLGGDNFIVGNMPNNPTRSRVQQGNNVYTMFNFKVPVTATRTGALTLGPATWPLTVYSGQRTFFWRVDRAAQLHRHERPAGH